jgi:hypothetical protein
MVAMPVFNNLTQERRGTNATNQFFNQAGIWLL